MTHSHYMRIYWHMMTAKSWQMIAIFTTNIAAQTFGLEFCTVLMGSTKEYDFFYESPSVFLAQDLIFTLYYK